MNTLLIETVLACGPTFQLVQGDITTEKTEAIVNAANESLRHGTGVAGAISQGGGPDIQTESDAWVQKHGPVSHADPAWTSGGRLPCRYVIHAVGPVWGGPGSDGDANLGAAVSGCLRVADELSLESISLPAISTGIFGFPKERAAGIIIKTVQNYFKTKSNSGIKVIWLFLCDASTITIFLKVWHDHFDA